MQFLRGVHQIDKLGAKVNCLLQSPRASRVSKPDCAPVWWLSHRRKETLECTIDSVSKLKDSAKLIFSHYNNISYKLLKPTQFITHVRRWKKSKLNHELCYLMIYFFVLRCVELYKSPCSTPHCTREKHSPVTPSPTDDHLCRAWWSLIILASISSLPLWAWPLLLITIMLQHGWNDHDLSH